VDEALARLREAAQGENTEAIEAATKALAAQTDEFAARRMDKSIRQALTGRKLNEL
jgi:molecular chaperone HscA